MFYFCKRVNPTHNRVLFQRTASALGYLEADQTGVPAATQHRSRGACITAHVHYTTDALIHSPVPTMFVLNPNSGIPIYRQLREQVQRMVASGQLKPGTELPSIRELAIKHAVNPMTVSKAYVLLEAEGFLVRHRGRPMTVANRSQSTSGRAQRVEQLTSHIDALVLAARQLELSAADVSKALRDRWDKTTGREIE